MSREELGGMPVRGVPVGKRTSTLALDKVRMLLPLGTLLTALDIPIAEALHESCDTAPPVPRFLEGAVRGPGRSAAEIALSVGLHIEKGA